jgi:hypothetical protein
VTVIYEDGSTDVANDADELDELYEECDWSILLGLKPQSEEWGFNFLLSTFVFQYR